MVVLSVLVGVLSLAVVLLAAKVISLRQAARELAAEFAARLELDTNTLVGISTRDKYMCHLANDINAQLRILREQRRRYLDGDRELKDAVTAISHDLRTPLTAIFGYLDLLEREEKSDTVVRYLAFIGDRAEAMRALTEELFRYSVILSGEQTPQRVSVCLNAALEQALAGFYGALCKRNITPEVEIPVARVERMLDPAALTRIFENILGNALKYSDGDLFVSLTPTGEIVFANTAADLNAVQVEKLFHRFFTVEAARSGTGLGLSIAKTLAEQMGGALSARYEAGKLYISLSFSD